MGKTAKRGEHLQQIGGNAAGDRVGAMAGAFQAGNACAGWRNLAPVFRKRGRQHDGQHQALFWYGCQSAQAGGP